MDKIKTLAKVGIGSAVLDFILRGFGPLYTTNRSEALDLGHYIFVGIIPAIAVLSSLGLMKGKKWGLYLGIILALWSLVATIGLMKGGNSFGYLSLLYIVIYGLLSFFSLQQSKNLS